MPELQFDNAKSFDDNLEDFLTYMEAEDSEMGSILRSNVDALKDAPDDSARRRARTSFNTNIVTSLDEKLKDSDGE